MSLFLQLSSKNPKAVSETMMGHYWYIAIIVFFVGVYGLYRWLLPKPLPGIPYNSSAVNSLFGDIPEMMREVSVTHEVMLWMARQTEKLNAPLCQVFIRPFSKPWLLLADFREAQDLLLRRGREFDRSSFTSDLMAPAGGFHIRFNSTDGKWKASRRWLQDLMTPAFLRGVAGPVIYDKTLHLIQLWEVKTKLSAGRPFSAAMDVHHVALDAVLAFTFGEQIKVSALRPQLEFLAKLDGLEDIVGHVVDDDVDEPVEFPMALLNEFIVSSIEGTVILEKLISSPMPKLALWWMSRTAWYKNIFAVKDRFIREQVEIAVAGLAYKNPSAPKTNSNSPVHSAVDHMLRREKAIAAKEERQPDFRSQDLVDEIFGNIIAGHDTTSSMLAWMMKFLTDKPSVQSKLRSALHASHSNAVIERRCPSFVEIASSRVAYLDAVLEESLRLSAISVTREATCDTELLGHHVPKGTVVVLVSNGPSCYSPSFKIDESKRSPTSRAASSRKWDESGDMKAFEPERWLAKGDNIDNGAVEGDFDPTAGPQLVFGLGTRGCFGKRLAYLEARIITTMIIWNFELLPIPASLGGYAAVDGVTHRARQCFVRLKKPE